MKENYPRSWKLRLLLFFLILCLGGIPVSIGGIGVYYAKNGLVKAYYRTQVAVAAVVQYDYPCTDYGLEGCIEYRYFNENTQNEISMFESTKPWIRSTLGNQKAPFYIQVLYDPRYLDNVALNPYEIPVIWIQRFVVVFLFTMGVLPFLLYFGTTPLLIRYMIHLLPEN